MDKTNFKQSEEFKKIYDTVKIENERVKVMTACKQFYKLYPEMKTEKLKPKKRTKKVNIIN